LAAEEAAAAEAERLRLEEIERKKIAAEDAVFEAEEAARVAAADAKLASQAEAVALVDAAHAEELAHLRRAEREAYEWDRFASCCSRPDPRDPRAMLAYETAARASTDSGLSLGAALDLACEHERIIAEAEVYREWALAEGAVEEAEALAACRGRMRALTEAATDGAVARLALRADAFQDAEGAILVRDAREGFECAVWMNHVVFPRFKAIEVPELGGLVVELPKEVATEKSIGLRAFRRAYSPFVPDDAEDPTSVGGVLTLELIELPPLATKTSGWTIREVTPLASRVHVRAYPKPDVDAPPPAANDVALDAPPVVVSVDLPADLVLSTEAPSPAVGWWDPVDRRWRTEGITDVTVEGRRLTFSTVKLTHLSLLRSRAACAPYRAWSIRPSADGETCVVSVTPGGEGDFFGAGGPIEITAGAGWCAIEGDGAIRSFPELESLRGARRTPRGFLAALERAGVFLAPEDRDCAAAGVTRKDPAVERAFCRDVARIAPAHAVASCRWNRDAGAGDALARVAEWTDYDLVAAEDVDKTFARERDGVVKTMLRKAKGVAIVDARHKRGELSAETRAHMADGRAPLVGAAAVRARMAAGAGGDALAPLEYFFDAPTALRESEADAAAESAIERIANAPAALVDTVESLLWTMRVFTFG